jgi:hypothetical protein
MLVRWAMKSRVRGIKIRLRCSPDTESASTMIVAKSGELKLGRVALASASFYCEEMN